MKPVTTSPWGAHYGRNHRRAGDNKANAGDRLRDAVPGTRWSRGVKHEQQDGVGKPPSKLRALKKALRCRVPHRSRDLTTRWREKLPTGQRRGKKLPAGQIQKLPTGQGKKLPSYYIPGGSHLLVGGWAVGGQADLLADSQ